MGSGVNWGKWTIFGPNDSTGPFIWHISQHTTTATSLIIVYNDQKKSKNSIKHENISKSKNFFFPWRNPVPSTIIFLIWFRNPVPSLRLYFWSGLWVSCDRIIIGGCTRSNCFIGSVGERNPCFDVYLIFKTHPEFCRIWTCICRFRPDFCWRERKSIYIVYIDR